MLNIYQLCLAQKKTNIDELDISKMIQPVPSNNMFIDSAYNIWCAAPIAGKNGKYYFTVVGQKQPGMKVG
jgi:hypothetical protein